MSFYPAHHITMGEGGAVLTDRPALKTLVESFRDWGRDCWCEPGKDNTCGKRFDWQLGDLPHGYDHKYTYSHIGYNLKLTDMQAAVGVAQLDKLPGFIAARRRELRAGCTRGWRSCEEFFVLPEATPGSEPSWFGFPLARPSRRAVQPRATLMRAPRVAARSRTRLLFAGNLVAPAGLRGRRPTAWSATSPNTDRVMHDAFWLGVYPGLTTADAGLSWWTPSDRGAGAERGRGARAPIARTSSRAPSRSGGTCAARAC